MSPEMLEVNLLLVEHHPLKDLLLVRPEVLHLQEDSLVLV
jgi:hypothetical protein